MRTDNIRQKLIQRTTERDLLEENLVGYEKKNSLLKQQMEDIEEARSIIQLVSKKTQEELEFHISEIVNLALSSIWSDPYKFEMKFVLRRNKTELDFNLLKNGERIKPFDGTGGGVIDIVSFALRIALWSIKRPRTRSTIILDEPFRFLGEMQYKAGDMLKVVSKKLGLQIIMVSHNRDLIDRAGRAFEVTQKNGISKVKCL